MLTPLLCKNPNFLQFIFTSATLSLLSMFLIDDNKLLTDVCNFSTIIYLVNTYCSVSLIYILKSLNISCIIHSDMILIFIKTISKNNCFLLPNCRVWRINRYSNTIRIVGPNNSIHIQNSDFLNTNQYSVFGIRVFWHPK